MSPAFDDSLRKAMAKETELFFESQADRIGRSRSCCARLQFLNDSWRGITAINNIYGSHFRRGR